MRCPDCNKFVSYDTEVEPEEESIEIDGTDFTGTFRRVLTCGDCGTELKEASIELTHDFENEIVEPDGVKNCKVCGGTGKLPPDAACDACLATGKVYPNVDPGHTHEFESEGCDVEATTDTKTTDRRGRPIKLARYMTTLYGVSAHAILKCECGAQAEFDVSDSIEASGMDELT